MFKKFFIFCFIFLFLKNLSADEKTILNRIENHFALEDFASALKESKKAFFKFPKSLKAKKTYIRALALKGFDREALKILKSSLLLQKDKELLEEISWGVLKKGIDSNQYAIKLAALIGIYFTKDAKAVKVLKSLMRDNNAILRSIAIYLASSYGDDILKKEISFSLDTEKVWFVRLEILKAIGNMKIKEKSGDLKEILKNRKASFEERILAIEALCSIYDSIDVEELKILLNSPYFGLSVLGCELATHFQVEGVEEDILRLLSHPINDVRIAALNAVALFYKDKMEREKLEKVLTKRLSDTNSFVAITASWVFLQIDKKKGEENLKKWIFDRYLENRRFAASAISQSGIFGEKLASFVLENSDDEYVKANIAIGLIGQRKKIKKSSDVLFNFIGNKTKMWMLESSKNPLFQSISPSRIRHIDQIPNYPEAIDQSIQLNILSILAILEDQRAEIAIRSFLKKKTWGITGLAAIMLLQEGDEKSLEVLKNLLKDEDKFIRIQAALALASIGKEKSVLDVLEKAYFEVDHRLKLIILESIGKVGSDKSFPFLLKVLEEPFLIRKILAAGALIQIINF